MRLPKFISHQINMVRYGTPYSTEELKNDPTLPLFPNAANDIYENGPTARAYNDMLGIPNTEDDGKHHGMNW